MPLINKVALLAALASPIALHAAGKGIERGLDFDSPGVLDISARPVRLHDAHDAATAPLDADVAKAILAAPVLDEGNPAALPFSSKLLGCGDEAVACMQTAEHGRIDDNRRRVARDGKQLVVTPIDGPAATFVDWVQPETKKADGDFETHYYLGRLAGSGYHRVEVQFGHDAPGSFLINPQSGKTAFVHNGGDVTALSQSGWHLADLVSSSDQVLRIAALDDNGPRIELQCAAAQRKKVDMRLKGWHNPFVLDLEIDLPAPAAARLTRAANGTWTIATPDAAQLDAAGFACQAPKS